jgi:hypothetical protein
MPNTRPIHIANEGLNTKRPETYSFVRFAHANHAFGGLLSYCGLVVPNALVIAVDKVNMMSARNTGGAM